MAEVRPDAELSGWLERRREATPLDSPLHALVRVCGFIY
jgi:hypothetical protein